MTTGSVAVDDFLALRDTLARVRAENVRLVVENQKLHEALEEARQAVRTMRINSES